MRKHDMRKLVRHLANLTLYPCHFVWPCLVGHEFNLAKKERLLAHIKNVSGTRDLKHVMIFLWS